MGTPANVIVGAATFYIAPANTPLPAFTGTAGAGSFVTPTTPWVLQGFTENGIKLNVQAKADEIRVEEQSTPALVTKDTTDFTLDFSLAEDIIANMQTAYGGGTITVQAATVSAPGYTQLALSDTLQELAFFATGTNPFGFQRGIYVPVCVSVAKVTTSYMRAKQARLYPVSLQAMCPLADILITDITAVVT